MFGFNHRVELCVDGQARLGMSTNTDLSNDQELIEFLEEVVRMLKAPSLPDPEVLGKYSP